MARSGCRLKQNASSCSPPPPIHTHTPLPFPFAGLPDLALETQLVKNDKLTLTTLSRTSPILAQACFRVLPHIHRTARYSGACPPAHQQNHGLLLLRRLQRDAEKEPSGEPPPAGFLWPLPGVVRGLQPGLSRGELPSPHVLHLRGGKVRENPLQRTQGGRRGWQGKEAQPTGGMDGHD